MTPLLLVHIIHSRVKNSSGCIFGRIQMKHLFNKPPMSSKARDIYIPSGDTRPQLRPGMRIVSTQPPDQRDMEQSEHEFIDELYDYHNHTTSWCRWLSWNMCRCLHPYHFFGGAKTNANTYKGVDRQDALVYSVRVRNAPRTPPSYPSDSEDAEEHAGETHEKEGEIPRTKGELTFNVRTYVNVKITRRPGKPSKRRHRKGSDRECKGTDTYEYSGHVSEDSEGLGESLLERSDEDEEEDNGLSRDRQVLCSDRECDPQDEKPTHGHIAPFRVGGPSSNTFSERRMRERLDYAIIHIGEGPPKPLGEFFFKKKLSKALHSPIRFELGPIPQTTRLPTLVEFGPRVCEVIMSYSNIHDVLREIITTVGDPLFWGASLLAEADACARKRKREVSRGSHLQEAVLKFPFEHERLSVFCSEYRFSVDYQLLWRSVVQHGINPLHTLIDSSHINTHVQYVWDCLSHMDSAYVSMIQRELVNFKPTNQISRLDPASEFPSDRRDFEKVRESGMMMDALAQEACLRFCCRRALLLDPVHLRTFTHAKDSCHISRQSKTIAWQNRKRTFLEQSQRELREYLYIGQPISMQSARGNLFGIAIAMHGARKKDDTVFIHKGVVGSPDVLCVLLISTFSPHLEQCQLLDDFHEINMTIDNGRWNTRGCIPGIQDTYMPVYLRPRDFYRARRWVDDSRLGIYVSEQTVTLEKYSKSGSGFPSNKS